jgi:hypothetical protein
MFYLLKLSGSFFKTRTQVRRDAKNARHMRVSRDDVYGFIAVAKGDIPAKPKEQQNARDKYQDLVDALSELRRQAPDDLTITHESVRERIEAAYSEHIRRNRRGKKDQT